ncbi:hypothetical protein Tco_1265797 [Tanacetum coccineum]
MTAFLEISQRPCDKYHNLEDDETIKIIFNSDKNMDGVGMKIPSWMITEEMKLTEHYRMTTSAPRSPNPETDEGESSAPRNSTVIRLRIPPRRSTRLTPPTSIPTTDEAGDLILQDTIQLSLAEQKSRNELEAKQNVQKVKEQLITKEIKKLVDGTENIANVEVDSSTLSQDDNQIDPDTRLEPRSDNESPKEESIAEVQPVNINEEEEESAEDDYKLKRKEKREACRGGLIMERQQSQSDVAKMITDAIQQEHENLLSEISLQINDAITNHIPSQIDSSFRNYMSGHLFHVHPTQATLDSAQEQQYQLYLTMRDNPQLQQDDLPIWLALKYKFEILHVFDTSYRSFVVRLRDQDDPHDDAHPEGENDAKRQKTSKHRTYVSGESLSGQANENDDELPTEKVSQELVDEMSQTIDEAKLRKVVNEMLRQRCTSRDEHQYNIDQMQNFLKNDILSFMMMILKKELPDRANGSIVSITESDYKNLNKNDIEDMYLLIIHGKVDDYAETRLLWSLSVFIRSIIIWERVHDFQLGVESYQQKVNLTAPTITFPSIEKYKMFFIVSEPVYDIIYKNNKKENRVMRHQEVYKFCVATLKRVLEGLKSYNIDVKHGYVTLSLSKDDVKYLQLFEEEIKEPLKHCDQMRWWKMYMNGRPLGSRRERPE